MNRPSIQLVLTLSFLFFTLCMAAKSGHASNHMEAPAVTASPSDVIPTSDTQRTNFFNTGANGISFGVDLGWNDGGELDTELDQNANNNLNDDGDDIKASFPTLGLDLRVNLGSLPNFQNRPRPPAFCGMWAKHNFGDNEDTGLNLSVHSGNGFENGSDTTLTLERNGFFMPYCGTGLFTIQQAVAVSMYFGWRLEHVEVTGITDEQGNVFDFQDSEWVSGFTVGLEGEMALVNNNTMGPTLFFGVTYDFMPDTEVDGRSNNFDYEFETESSWYPRVYLGLRWGLGVPNFF